MPVRSAQLLPYDHGTETSSILVVPAPIGDAARCRDSNSWYTKLERFYRDFRPDAWFIQIFINWGRQVSHTTNTSSRTRRMPDTGWCGSLSERPQASLNCRRRLPLLLPYYITNTVISNRRFQMHNIQSSTWMLRQFWGLCHWDSQKTKMLYSQNWSQPLTLCWDSRIGGAGSCRRFLTKHEKKCCPSYGGLWCTNASFSIVYAPEMMRFVSCLTKLIPSVLKGQ